MQSILPHADGFNAIYKAQRIYDSCQTPQHVCVALRYERLMLRAIRKQPGGLWVLNAVSDMLTPWFDAALSRI